MRDWTAAAHADRVARNDQRRRQLSPLELIRRRLDAVQYVLHKPRLESSLDDLLRRCLLLKVQLQHAVELVIRRQRLIVKLPRRELRGRPFANDTLRNDLAFTIQILRKRLNLSLQHVANHRKPAVGIAIQCAIAQREF